MAETRFQKAVANYDSLNHKLVLPIELVIDDFQQFLAFNKPQGIASRDLPDVMPITTDSLPAISHPDWGEIINAKGSFGWQPKYEYTRDHTTKYKGYDEPNFVISASFKNLRTSFVKIQYSAKFQVDIFRECFCRKS